MNNDIGNVIY